MADHERGEVVAWKHSEDFEEFTTNQSWPKYYPDLWTPLVRQSDYLEAVAERDAAMAARERAYDNRDAALQGMDEACRQRDDWKVRAQAAEAENATLRADNEALRIAYEGAAIDRDELRARIEGIDKILEPLTGEG